MKKLVLLALLAVSPLAQALTDSEEALARIREQTKNQYIFVSDEAKASSAEQEYKDALARVSKRTGIPVETFLSEPEKAAPSRSFDSTAELLKGIDLAKLEQQEAPGIDWLNVGLALTLSAAALLVSAVGVRAAVRKLRSANSVREKTIENCQRLAALVVVCTVLGSFISTLTYDINPMSPVGAGAIWLVVIGAVYGVARFSRPVQPQQ